MLAALGFEVRRNHAYSPQEAVAFGAVMALHFKGLGRRDSRRSPIEAWAPAVDAVLIADAETAHGWLVARPLFAVLVEGPELAVRAASRPVSSVLPLAPLWEAVT
jgi:hypothetical protein